MFPLVIIGRKDLPAGVELVQLLTVMAGRPPANDDVVRIRKVRAPICDEVKVVLMVVGLLTADVVVYFQLVEGWTYGW